MNTASLKAALAALISQAAAIAVLYGIVNSDQAAQWSTLAFGFINGAFLIAHAIHSQTAAQQLSALPSDAQELGSPPPAPVPPAVQGTTGVVVPVADPAVPTPPVA